MRIARPRSWPTSSAAELSSSVQAALPTARAMASMPSTSSPAPTGTITTSPHPWAASRATSSSRCCASRSSSPHTRVPSTSTTRWRAQQARAASWSSRVQGWGVDLHRGGRVHGQRLTEDVHGEHLGTEGAMQLLARDPQQLAEPVPAGGRADDDAGAGREPDAGGVLLALDRGDDGLEADVEVGAHRGQQLVRRAETGVGDVEVDERPQPSRAVEQPGHEHVLGVPLVGRGREVALGHDDVRLDAVPRLLGHRLPGDEGEDADHVAELDRGVHRVERRSSGPPARARPGRRRRSRRTPSCRRCGAPRWHRS